MLLISPAPRCRWTAVAAGALAWLAIALLTGAGPALGAPPPSGDKIGPGVEAEIEAAGEARVLVAVEQPPGPPDGMLAQARAPEAVRARVDEVLATVPEPHAHVMRRFGSVHAFAAVVDQKGLEKLARHPRVRRIDLDAPGEGSMVESMPLNQVQAVVDLMLTGQGTRVAVLDSGVDRAHADLGGALVDEACFCSGGGGCCHNGMPIDIGFGSAQDDNGHGSNVSGVLISDGFISPLGAAPDAEIVNVKVLDSFAEFCCASDVVAGLDWIILNHPEVDVVNLSLGTSATFPGECDNATAFTMAFADAVSTLRAMDILTIASSGNGGSGTELEAPACVSDAFSVAAAWDASLGAQNVLGCVDLSTSADQVTCFSNTNDTLDLIVSGNPMTASGLGTTTSTFVGTSNASPLASGCALLIHEAHPNVSADTLEVALATSPVSVMDLTNGLSFPRLDCLEALTYAASVTPRPIPGIPTGLQLLFGALLGGILVLARIAQAR